jgi:hypothetical protein
VLQIHYKSSRAAKLVRPAFSAAAACTLGLMIHFACAQTPAPGPRLTAGPTYTSADGKGDPKFPNVDIAFSLVGPDGSPIVAKPSELKLVSQGKEIGTATSIRPFGQTGYGITAILALDASGSMRGAPINAIHSSIARFVNQARTQDKVEVITFADQSQIDVPFGSSQAALTKELETVQARGKFTRLYDGLLDALGQFNSNQPKRRQLVVISDGHDEGSHHPITDVLVRAKSLGVVIDSIGLTKDHGEYLGSLQQLSNETGGTYRRVRSGTEGTDDLDNFIGQGIQATRATPVATFKADHLASDNTTHSTQLRWQPGNITSTAFIKTPQGSVLSNHWIWILGGCFVAGLILLVISWLAPRGRAKPPVSAQIPTPAPQPPPVRPALTSAGPDSTPTPIPSGSRVGDRERTPTLPDTDTSPSVHRTFEPSKPAVTTFETPLALPDTSRVRNKTKLAVFFEAPQAGPYATIRVLNGELTGQSFPMTTIQFTIGALAGNSLTLPHDPTVSGNHARLLWEESIVKIEDLKSTNGTQLNGKPLAAGRNLLRPGDEICVGQTRFIVDRV